MPMVAKPRTSGAMHAYAIAEDDQFTVRAIFTIEDTHQ